MDEIEYDNLIDRAFVMVRKDKASMADVRTFFENEGIENSEVQNMMDDVVARIIKAKKKAARNLILFGVFFIIYAIVRVGVNQGIGMFSIVFIVLGVINILLGITRISSADKDID